MKPTQAHTRRSAGFSLVEIAMCLAIMAVVLAMTMILANNATMSFKTNDVSNEVNTIVNVVHNLSASQGSYLGINTTYLATPVTLPNGTVTSQLPPKWINSSASTLNSAFGPATVTTAGGAPTTFTITFTNIPNQACENLATAAQGTGLSSATIDTVAHTLPMTPTAASAVCVVSSGTYKNSHMFAWQFY
jgi:prepilin-type N-terminal cleavage/methylation domain-containing protein